MMAGTSQQQQTAVPVPHAPARFHPYRPNGGMTTGRGAGAFRHAAPWGLNEIFGLYDAALRGSTSQAPPEPKYLAAKSHPRKLERHFKKDVVNPDDVIDVDSDAEDDSAEWEEVPICAGCDRELFLGDPESQDGSRPCALSGSSLFVWSLLEPGAECGHLVCALCAQDNQKRFLAHLAQKRRQQAATKRGKRARTTRNSKRSNTATTASVTSAVDLEDDFIFEPCPVAGCDGDGTNWRTKLGTKDGLWQVFL
jgi:hypothetical protein